MILSILYYVAFMFSLTVGLFVLSATIALAGALLILGIKRILN